MAKEALAQDLADFLVTKNFDPEYFDEQGQPAEAGDAKTVKFDYVSQSGKNYGTAVLVLADDELNFFYGDNLGRGMEQEDKSDWFQFLEQLSDQAASHSSIWSPKDINQLKHTLAGIAAIKEGLFEGYYGTKKVSYMGEQTTARLVINHNRTLGEDDKRYRYVESLYIETAEQERFKLPFKSLAGGRAMLEHVRQGGRPYDVRGTHLAEIVAEMAVLSRFNRAQHNRVFEGVTQQLVESAQQYYHRLQETMKHLGSSRGYQAYFESWTPDQVSEQESLVEDLRTMFIEQTLDARIEAALPTLAKIQQQETKMKEAQIFESWINQLSEGTWALPETPEQQEKLNQLMSAELIVGPDATNATELLYDLIGDDQLFDILQDLADRSEGRANIWDDSDVQDRLAELGIQTPQSTEAEPADVEQDTAPGVKEAMGVLGEKDVEEATAPDRAGQSRLRAAMQSVADDDFQGEDLAYHAVAALFTNKMWNVDWMSDIVDVLLQANPSEDELKYIIVNKKLPGRLNKRQFIERLKDARYPNNDTAQFGRDMYEEQGVAEDSLEEGWKSALAGAGLAAAGALGGAAMTSHTDASRHNQVEKPAATHVAQAKTQAKSTQVKAPQTKAAMKTNQVSAPQVGSERHLDDPEWVKNRLQGDYHFDPAKAEVPPSTRSYKESMAEGDNLARMLKHAGVPIREGVLTDSTGSTLEHIKDTFRREVKDFMQTGELNYRLERALYDYYYDDMPYGAKTGEDLDTSEWVSDRFAQDLGIDEGWKGALAGGLAGAALGSVSPVLGTALGGLAGAYAGHKLGDQGLSDPDKEYKQRQAQQQKPVSEGSCNMTMEGEYCPEHGLAECGMASGGAVGMPYSMGEDRPHPKELEMDALVRQMQIQQRADAAEKRLAQRAAEPKNVFQKVKKDIGEPIGKLAQGDIKGAFLEGTDDPINSNSAMTGSYYESRDGDALLARIKSLALIK